MAVSKGHIFNEGKRTCHAQRKIAQIIDANCANPMRTKNLRVRLTSFRTLCFNNLKAIFDVYGDKNLRKQIRRIHAQIPTFYWPPAKNQTSRGEPKKRGPFL